MGKKSGKHKANTGNDLQLPRPADQVRFLYQPALPGGDEASTLNKLAERAGESTASWKAKIESRVLQLNAAVHEEATALVGRQPEPYTVRHSFTKFSGISNRAAKRAGLLAVGPEVDFEHAQVLRTLWQEYIADVLGKHNAPVHVARNLALCDLHGAYVEVVGSACAAYVGIAGIIVRETHHAFYIVKSDSKVALVLKEGTIFALEWDRWKFHIHGAHFAATPAQRSKRKLKAKSKL
ncbi:ribonuclease P subunit p29 isoform X2 [Babesia ovata]|uniref:Ribonuclease P subunit p29 isoform X2 n=1 Tax=Babesia ovata TaxID=189622 RepID=A0A2H6KB35_9APIC|nr:ribonuclease P subunit p29 isoform X2 [Babesia ovata]GBE60200.1 ribonuclease P subunit p29 isoform X2 [Babesia ovata]